MRTVNSLPAALLVAFAVLSSGSASAAECFGSGYRSTFGADGAAFFEVRGGQPCHYAFNVGGVVRSSKILTRPKNGSVRMLNLTSFEYKPKPGYRGPDTFTIEAVGTSQTGSGRSVLTMNVAVE